MTIRHRLPVMGPIQFIVPDYAEITSGEIDLLSNSGSFKLIETVDDLPRASAGVRTLPNGSSYLITGAIDLQGDAIECGEAAAIAGVSNATCSLRSTGLTGAPLITTTGALGLDDLLITADTVIDADGTGSGVTLNWSRLIFADCPTIGTIKGYSNALFDTVSARNSANWTFDGSMNSVAFTSSGFDSRTGQTVLILPATLSLAVRLRIIYSVFTINAGETGISVADPNSFPSEGMILDKVNFSGGGTYVSGLMGSNEKSRWEGCRGVENSAVVGYMTMNGNGTPTQITPPLGPGEDVPVKAAGTTTNQNSERFSHSDNRLTYTGALTRTMRVILDASVLDGNNNQIATYIAKNGSVIAASASIVTANATGRAENVTTQTVVSMATGDYLEMWVANNSGTTDVTVESMSMTVFGGV